jgi:pimeloyl-ACP methyl ester carboxylesterase
LQQSLKINGVTLTYSDDGNGPAVVFVHGIPTDFRIWENQRKALSSYRSICYSRRFASPNQNAGDVSDSTVQINSEDLVGLIHELNLNRICLVGHSYGGFVSLFTAWKHPDLVRALILVEPAVPSILVKNEKDPIATLGFLLANPGAALSARRFQTGKLRAALKAYESGDYKNAVANFYNGIRENDNAFDRAPQELREIMLDNGKTVGELESVFPVFTKSDAAQLLVPTLLVKGEHSPKWLRAIVDGLHGSMPNNSIIEISNSGHLPHVDNPGPFNTELIAFLQKNA